MVWTRPASHSLSVAPLRTRRRRSGGERLWARLSTCLSRCLRALLGTSPLRPPCRGRRGRRRRTSSRPSRTRARRRQRQWHAPGSFSWSSALHAMFPSFVGRPKLHGIVAGMDKKDSIALFSGSCMCKVGFTGDPASGAVFLPFVRPKMLRIMAGTHQKDSCPRLMVQTAENCGKSAFAVLRWSSFFLSWCSHGLAPYSALWFNSGYIFMSVYGGWSRLQITADSPQLQFIAGHRHPVRAAEADSQSPDYSADQRDSAVAVRILWSMSPLCGPCSLSGARRGEDIRAPTVAAR